MHCPNCEVGIQAGWKACPACGEQLPESMVCPSCGKELDAHWKACPHCATVMERPNPHPTTIQDSVVKEVRQTSVANQQSASGATIGGSININIPSAGNSVKPEFEYENQVMGFLRAEANLEKARPELETTRGRLGIPLHVATQIEHACLEREKSGQSGDGLREKWDRIRPALRIWADNEKQPFPEDGDTLSVLRDLAQNGDNEAQCFLGLCYQRAEHVDEDYTEAVRWLQRSAEQGNSLAERMLGWRYLNGEGVVADEDEAVKWFRRALQHRDSSVAATRRLGLILNRRKDYEEAARVFLKLAQKGDASAQSMIGAMHWDGNGVSQDDEEAIRWWTKAVSGGSVSAHYLLGQAYELGCGIPEDVAKAIELYEKAARKGNKEAKERLVELGGRG